eukprot:sb/3469645/
MKPAIPVMETVIGTVDLVDLVTAALGDGNVTSEPEATSEPVTCEPKDDPEVTTPEVAPGVTPEVTPGVTPVNTPEPQGTTEVQEDTANDPELSEVPDIPELPKQSDECVTPDSEESDEFVVPEPTECHGFMAPGPVPKVKTASTSTQIYPLPPPPPPSYRKQPPKSLGVAIAAAVALGRLKPNTLRLSEVQTPARPEEAQMVRRKSSLGVRNLLEKEGRRLSQAE